MKTEDYTKTGIDEWIDAKKCKPALFEIVVLKTEDKIANGWYQGESYSSKWFSLRWQRNTEVLYWKPTEDHFIGGPKHVW